MPLQLMASMQQDMEATREVRRSAESELGWGAFQEAVSACSSRVPSPGPTRPGVIPGVPDRAAQLTTREQRFSLRPAGLDSHARPGSAPNSLSCSPRSTRSPRGRAGMVHLLQGKASATGCCTKVSKPAVSWPLGVPEACCCPCMESWACCSCVWSAHLSSVGGMQHACATVRQASLAAQDSGCIRSPLSPYSVKSLCLPVQLLPVSPRTALPPEEQRRPAQVLPVWPEQESPCEQHGTGLPEGLAAELEPWMSLSLPYSITGQARQVLAAVQAGDTAAAMQGAPAAQHTLGDPPQLTRLGQVAAQEPSQAVAVPVTGGVHSARADPPEPSRLVLHGQELVLFQEAMVQPWDCPAGLRPVGDQGRSPPQQQLPSDRATAPAGQQQQRVSHGAAAAGLCTAPPQEEGSKPGHATELHQSAGEMQNRTSSPIAPAVQSSNQVPLLQLRQETASSPAVTRWPQGRQQTATSPGSCCASPRHRRHELHCLMRPCTSPRTGGSSSRHRYSRTGCNAAVPRQRAQTAHVSRASKTSQRKSSPATWTAAALAPFVLGPMLPSRKDDGKTHLPIFTTFRTKKHDISVPDRRRGHQLYLHHAEGQLAAMQRKLSQAMAPNRTE